MNNTIFWTVLALIEGGIAIWFLCMGSVGGYVAASIMYFTFGTFAAVQYHVNVHGLEWHNRRRSGASDDSWVLYIGGGYANPQHPPLSKKVIKEVVSQYDIEWRYVWREFGKVKVYDVADVAHVAQWVLITAQPTKPGGKYFTSPLLVGIRFKIIREVEK